MENLIDYVREDIKSLRADNKNVSKRLEDTLCKELTEIKNHLKTLNGRTRGLEVWRGFITGGMGVIGFIVIYLLSIVKDSFFK